MNKYCRGCGTPLVKVLADTTYDATTGKPMQWFVYPCPKYSWWKPWTYRHVAPHIPRYDHETRD